MAEKNISVFGIYRTPELAEHAVDHLLSVGFTNSAISILLQDNKSTRDFAHEKNTKAPEGTATGATVGGVIGGTLGLLAGLGALAIPGVGPLIAAGPIIGALTGLGVGGAVGGIAGALVGMGIPEYEAKRYEGHVKNGGTLLSVHCDTSEQVAVAKDALKATGAIDISSGGEEAAADPESVHRASLNTPSAVVPPRETSPPSEPVNDAPPMRDPARVRDSVLPADRGTMPVDRAVTPVGEVAPPLEFEERTETRRAATPTEAAEAEDGSVSERVVDSEY